MEPIEIMDYDPHWPVQFAGISERVRAAFADGPRIAAEHVGSTSVACLAAKPIVNLNVVVWGREDIAEAVERLARLGYVHQGDLGITGREAFCSPPGVPAHHLYICAADNAEYHRQVALRNYLRAHPDEAQQYGVLKRTLAARHGVDRGAYSEAKTEFIEAVLEKAQGSKGG